MYGSIPMPFPERPADENLADVKDHDSDRPTESQSSVDCSMADENSDCEKDKIPLEERLMLAEHLKVEGAENMKALKYEEAAMAYGTALQKLTQNNKSSEENSNPQYKNMYVALHLNLSLCHIKLDKWLDAVRHASSALELDKTNPKGLYRRGLARSRLGLLEEAKADLMTVYENDKTNVEVIRELQSIKQSIIEAKARDKERFNSLFDRASGLYNDREKQMAEERRLHQEKQKKEEEEYQKVNQKRAKSGKKPFESIEAWKESTNKSVPTNSASTQKNTSCRKTSKESPPVVGTDSLDLDEEEKKIVMETKKMGYCYFNRKQDADSSNQSVQPKCQPTKIDKTKPPSENQVAAAQKKSLSSWNSAGTTYEEKDCSTWFASKFKEVLSQCKSETSYGNIQVNSVEDVQCEGEIVILRGSKRYLYDCNCRLMWSMSHSSGKEISGSITLNDISSNVTSSKNSEMSDDNCPDWLRVAKVKTDQKLDQSIENQVKEAILALKKEIKKNVQFVEAEFRQHG